MSSSETSSPRLLGHSSVGPVPSVVALNKVDLTDDWKLSQFDEAAAGGEGVHRLKTSAKTGQGVEDAFQWLATATLSAPEKTR